MHGDWHTRDLQTAPLVYNAKDKQTKCWPVSAQHSALRPDSEADPSEREYSGAGMHSLGTHMKWASRYLCVLGHGSPNSDSEAGTLQLCLFSHLRTKGRRHVISHRRQTRTQTRLTAGRVALATEDGPERDEIVIVSGHIKA